MPNFTNLPERHFVDKAKKLSFGDQDKDTYFDGDTLEAMLEELNALKSKKLYQHLIYDSKYGLYFTIYSTTATACYTYADVAALQTGKILAQGFYRPQKGGMVVSYEPYFITDIYISDNHVTINMWSATNFTSTSAEEQRYSLTIAMTKAISDTVTQIY